MKVDCKLELGGTDYQAYYDKVTQITWLTDASLFGRRFWGPPTDISVMLLLPTPAE